MRVSHEGILRIKHDCTLMLRLAKSVSLPIISFVCRGNRAPVHKRRGAGLCHDPPVGAYHDTGGAHSPGLQGHDSGG